MSEPSFIVEWPPTGINIKMCDENIHGNQLDMCSMPIICQELKCVLKIDFDFAAEGFQVCTTKCSQWQTMNEITFMLHTAIKNNHISYLQSGCKIESQDNGSNLLPGDNNNSIVQIPSYNMQFETIIGLAREEYEYILKDGWEKMVGDASDEPPYFQCTLCNEELKVLGYSNTRDASLNGVNQADIDLMTSSDCICGYFGCNCRFHLKCLLKRICSNLCNRMWMCDHHQVLVVSFFITDNCGFPLRKYGIPNIVEQSDYQENFEMFSRCLKCHLALVQMICGEYKVHFGSIMLSVQENV